MSFSWSPGRIAGLVIAVFLLVVGGCSLGQLVEGLDASEIMVVQSLGGTLNVYSQPGIYPQWFGTVTKYRKRDQFRFDCPERKDVADHSLRVTFNDGGTGRVCGELAWEMPTTPEQVISLHSKYRSHENIEMQLVTPVVQKAVTFAGPLMSSTESYAARKADLLSFIEDQIDKGVYRTNSEVVRWVDQQTKQERSITRVEILKDPKTGLILRQEETSALTDFGIRTFNLAIKRIVYDSTVEQQINKQQQAFAEVQTAMANARKAEQDAVTKEMEGRANAAEAKWKQETIKATEVTKAQQEYEVALTAAKKNFEVAQLEAKAAGETKRKDILLGEGESERRKLVMAADGALDRKLEAWLKSQEFWASAFANFKGKVVPDIVSGGNAQGNAAINFMEVMGAKAAKDLAVDLQNQSAPKR